VRLAYGKPRVGEVAGARGDAKHRLREAKLPKHRPRECVSIPTTPQTKEPPKRRLFDFDEEILVRMLAQIL
jgi:hypothetical protein